MERAPLTRVRSKWEPLDDPHVFIEILGVPPDDLDFVMFLPRLDEYVALHDTTFHVHEHPQRRADG